MTYALPVNDILKHCNKILLNLETNVFSVFTAQWCNGNTSDTTSEDFRFDP